MGALFEPSPRTIIDELLDEQRQLTAVERFARKHEAHLLPSQARYYEDLIPLSRPRTGEQYAFAVNLDTCTGCKACVSACHSLNGLDDDEVWRNVGLLSGGAAGSPWQQTVTTACHHCEDPACANGCPTLAYEKDADTGIVRHLDDQCIGCQYCMLKCPYDVPKFSKTKGIVRKCDMCQSRLAVGEAPACVQACPNGAIRIEVVSTSRGRKSGARLVPGSFESSYTRPTTTYRTTRGFPANAAPADENVLRLADPHLPLVGMLVLTQMAAGMHLALPLAGESRLPLAAAAFLILNAGLFVSVLHLGQPLKAWRAFLGLRRSWMSREIVAFGVYALAAFGALFSRGGALAAAALGIVAVACSAMIYVDTRRRYWTASATFPRFFGATFALGAAACGTVLALFGSALTTPCLLASAVFQTALLAWESATFVRALRNFAHAQHRSALTTWILLRPVVLGRVVLGGIAIVAAIGAAFSAFTFPLALLSISCATAAQLAERFQFFRAVDAPRMPGL